MNNTSATVTILSLIDGGSRPSKKLGKKRGKFRECYTI